MTNTHSGSEARILIAGPGSDLRTQLREILERAGYVIAGEAVDEDQTVALALELDPALIVMDGLDVAHSIHAQRPALKIVVITQETKPSEALRILKAGARDFIVKPFQEQQVLDVVRNALEC